MVTLKEKLSSNLNQQKLEKLLEPPARSGRVRIVETPALLPRKCAVTGRYKDDYFIDLGFDTGDFFGQAYICSGIVEEIVKITGYVKADAYREQLESNIELSRDAMTLLEENKRIKDLLNEYLVSSAHSINDDLAERIRDLDNSFTEQAATADSREVVRGRENEKPRFNKSSGKQGLANVSSLKLSGAPTI